MRSRLFSDSKKTVMSNPTFFMKGLYLVDCILLLFYPSHTNLIYGSALFSYTSIASRSRFKAPLLFLCVCVCQSAIVVIGHCSGTKAV